MTTETERKPDALNDGEPEVVDEVEVVEETTEPPTAEQVEDEVGKALALREKTPVPTSALPSTDEYNVLSTLAHRTFQTTFVPAAYRGREADVFAAFLFGREIGLGPMMALRDIYMIDGRPTIAAHRQLAKLREGGIVILESEVNRERAFIRAKRRDTGEEMSIEFTYEQAELVDGGKLVAKNNWKSWREDMLWSRVVGRLCRRLGPDLLGGLPPYVAEEVADFSGYQVEYDEAGTPSFQKADEKPSPKSWADVFEWAGAYDPSLGWPEWVRDASEALYGTRERASLTTEQVAELGAKAAAAIVALRESHDPGTLPPPDRAAIRSAWKTAGVEAELPGPLWRLSPDEVDRPPWVPAETVAEPSPAPVAAVPDEPATDASTGSWPSDPDEPDPYAS